MVKDDPAAPELAPELVPELVPELAPLGHRVKELERANSELRSRLRVEMALNEASGKDLGALVAVLHHVTGLPVALFDANERRVSHAGASGAGSTVPPPTRFVHEQALRAAEAEEAEQQEPVEEAVSTVTLATRSGSRVPAYVAAVRGPQKHFGWVVVEEHGPRFSAATAHAVRRVADRLADEFAVQARIARVAWEAKGSLARQLARGSLSPDELRVTGDHFGVNVTARRILAYLYDLTPFEGEHVRVTDRDEEITGRFERFLGLEVLPIRSSEGLLLLIEVDEGEEPGVLFGRARSAVQEVVDSFAPGAVVASLAAPCPPEGLRVAYRETREVTSVLARFAGPHGAKVLSVGDLGPARLFLANGDPRAMQSYAEGVFRVLQTERMATELLGTLNAWFGAMRSIKQTALGLALHENTVRLRLARVAALTGLDLLCDPNDQLAVQTALLVLRLQGHPALPPMTVAHDTTQVRHTA